MAVFGKKAGDTKITPIRLVAEEREMMEAVAVHHEETLSGTVRLLVKKEFDRINKAALRKKKA